MELAQLIKSLQQPSAYPYAVEHVDVRQTHISVVFLAGNFVYKIKKPVALGFLDFSTLDKRHHYCQEEVRLNRRLAPTVYQGVVAVTQGPAELRFEGTGEAVEWAVKMERLPEEATLQKRLQRGEINSAQLISLAQRLASFHAQAETNERIAAFARFDVVAQNARENFEVSAAHVGTTVTKTVYDRLQALTEEFLARLKSLIESRIARDTHGDLHLDHVYLFPDKTPPDDLVIVDCIEFNERFRFADPVSDMAFLTMDLKFHGQGDLAQAFTAAYFQASGDQAGKALLPFYEAYRAAVRAKVDGLKLQEKEIPQAERDRTLARAHARWLLALGILETPARRPCLVMIGGLPGSGKSTLARKIAERAGFQVIRSDVVRKELAGLPEQDSARAHFGEGIYTEAWTERTYAECWQRAEKILLDGGRVIVDASFSAEKNRQLFLDGIGSLAVSAIFLVCQASPEVIRQRLEQRHHDASDADWSVYQQAAKRWQEAGPNTRKVLHTIPTDGREVPALMLAEKCLRELSLLP